jgi:hypothetical protein
VTFGPLKRALRGHRHPVTTAELREQYAAVETPTAAKRFDGLLEACEATRFREPRAARDAALAVLSQRDGSASDPSPETAADWTRLRR